LKIADILDMSSSGEKTGKIVLECDRTVQPRLISASLGSVMSWIAIAGKSLEFRGQLIQPPGFQDWADKQLQQKIEEIAREETSFFFQTSSGKKVTLE
jgi:hypothetical protein